MHGYDPIVISSTKPAPNELRTVVLLWSVARHMARMTFAGDLFQSWTQVMVRRGGWIWLDIHGWVWR